MRFTTCKSGFTTYSDESFFAGEPLKVDAPRKAVSSSKRCGDPAISRWTCSKENFIKLILPTQVNIYTHISSTQRNQTESIHLESYLNESMQLKYLNCKQSLLTVESKRSRVKNIVAQYTTNHMKLGESQKQKKTNTRKHNNKLDRNENRALDRIICSKTIPTVDYWIRFIGTENRNSHYLRENRKRTTCFNHKIYAYP